MTRFELQFEPGLIWELAARYSYPKDNAAARQAGHRARERAYYTRDELLAVYRWKAPRSEWRFAPNDEETVVVATRQAFDADDEGQRMEALSALDGVGVPTASALLHFALPEDYPILDVRALESLGVKGRGVYPTSIWLGYLAACRGLAHTNEVSMRTLDKALWQYSKERGC